MDGDTQTGSLDPDLRSRLGRSEGLLGWEDLLAKRRVVVLAEAGSGKTAEMAEQARLQTEAGRFAFYATVEDVGQDGLASALHAADRARLATWRTSNEAAWFFIDSVDEAKLIGVRLEKAVRRLGDGIVGAERRAHIVLSGRLTDWEFRRDLKRLKDGLPILNDPVLPPPPTPDEVLISTFRHERRKEEAPTVEEPLVVLMASLDPCACGACSGQGRTEPGSFMEPMDAADLWRFAQTPSGSRLACEVLAEPWPPWIARGDARAQPDRTPEGDEPRPGQQGRFDLAGAFTPLNGSRLR